MKIAKKNKGHRGIIYNIYNKNIITYLLYHPFLLKVLLLKTENAENEGVVGWFRALAFAIPTHRLRVSENRLHD